MPLKISPTSSK